MRGSTVMPAPGSASPTWPPDPSLPRRPGRVPPPTPANAGKQHCGQRGATGSYAHRLLMSAKVLGTGDQCHRSRLVLRWILKVDGGPAREPRVTGWADAITDLGNTRPAVRSPRAGGQVTQKRGSYGAHH